MCALKVRLAWANSIIDDHFLYGLFVPIELVEVQRDLNICLWHARQFEQEWVAAQAAAPTCPDILAYPKIT